MANNGRIGEQVEVAVGTLPSEEEVTRKLGVIMDSLKELIDSPKTQFILRNTVLTLLELPDYKFDVKLAFALVTDIEARREAAAKLTEMTPKPWSDTWNSSWSKDAEPNYCKLQQCSMRRLALAEFWSKEWEDIPVETRRHVASLLANLR